MTIKEINFNAIESVRKRCITFAKDGNTVVKPYKTFYCVEKLTQDSVHKNYYIEVVKGKEDWEESSFNLWEDLEIICIKVDWIPRYFTLERFIDALDKLEYQGSAGLFKRLEDAERNDFYINKVDIEVCVLLGKTDLAKHYAEYREKQIAAREAKRQAEAEERKRKKKEEEEKRIAGIEKAISDATYKIHKQEDMDNKEVDGKSIINKLMEKYGIKVPLRTQGWINSKLAMITFNGGNISYKYYGRSQRDNSKVFKKYLLELENAINNELDIPF